MTIGHHGQFATRGVLAVVLLALASVAMIMLAPSASRPAGAATGSWTGAYFTNVDLSGSPLVTRNDGAAINFSWDGVQSPAPGVPGENFSVRWTRADSYAAGTYRFSVSVDDGVRIFVDGQNIMDHWIDEAQTNYSVDYPLTAASHTVTMEYYNACCPGIASLTIAPAAPLSGFVTDTVASGLTLPTAIAFAPDGRIFIALKDGQVKIVKNGVLLGTNFYTVSPVNSFHDRGMLGLALDPNFASNGFVYLSYVYDNKPSDPAGAKAGQIIRITASGDTALAATKKVLLGTVTGSPSQPSCENFSTTADCIPADSDSHSAGNLKFGPDGMLYAAWGEGADASAVDSLALRSQNIGRLSGKILRVNPADGKGLSDNPFTICNPTCDLTATRSKVWAYGLRNDFRFNFRPGTNTIVSGDVQWDTEEEVNRISGGENMGWPCYEGSQVQPGFAAFQTCQNLYNAGSATFGIYFYGHTPVSSAVVGGAFTGVNGYPPAYQNTYFFGDYVRNQITVMRLDGSSGYIPNSFAVFQDGTAGGPVDIEIGPEGDVYYVAINAGEIRHIRYVSGNRPPVAVAAGVPTSGVAPLSVGFSSQGSNDPDAGQAITFDWDFGDGSAHATTPSPTHIYATASLFTATLTVTDPFNATATATVNINSTRPPPVATISGPADGSHYNIGDTITFAGTGFDNVDGPLSGTSLAWTIVLNHCTDATFTSCHTHPYFSTTGAGGSFVASDHGDFTNFDIFLTVTNSAALTNTKKVNVTPNRVTLSLASNDPGVALTVDGTLQVVPFTRSVPRNSAHVLFAPSPQLAAGNNVEFDRWPDNGFAQHAITAPADATWTATFVPRCYGDVTGESLVN